MRLGTAALLFLVIAIAPARAQSPGDCTLGVAQGDLDVSNVFARVFNTGSLFFGNSTTSGDGYLVPRFGSVSPLFGAGLWVGATVDGDLRVAGSRYNNFTFWPGPLEDGAALPDRTDCSPFDRIYVVSGADVRRYEETGEASADLADWPVGLGAPAVDASGMPVVPTSRDQTLDLAAGERPVIFGSQTAWWVMNDVGNDHFALSTDPLGIEVRVSAFAIAGADLTGAAEATFYRYEIENRSANTLEAARAGIFTDPDLGDAGDDFVGSDSTRGMFFAYNAEDQDAAYGTPPALGFDFLSGAGGSFYFENAQSGPTTDPQTGQEIYNVLQNLWKDGTPVYAFGNGYNQPQAPIVRWVFPGDPVVEEFWSEVNDGVERRLGGDRRGGVTSPPFTLAPGETYTFDLGILFAQGDDRFDSITELRAVSDAVQAAYDDGSLFTLDGKATLLAAPALVSPEDGANLVQQDTISFAWEPVDGATRYAFQWYPDSTSGPRAELTEETEIRLPVTRLISASGIGTFAWRVVALNDASNGLPSETRSVRVFRRGVLSLPDGNPAYAEVQNANGTDVCGPNAVSTDGCEALANSGNPVYHSLNSLGTYYFSEQGTGSETNLAEYAPNEFEIRFSDEGSLAGYLFQSPYNVIRVPFEVWDIGVVQPGEANDPSDDVQLIPYLFADNGGMCEFAYGEIPEEATFGFPATDRIYAYYPQTSYADFEATFADLVEAAPNGCSEDPNRTQGEIFFGEGVRPIQRQVFADFTRDGVLPGSGTTVRMYTQDSPPVSSEPGGPEASALRLSVDPNPASGAATARFTLDASGEARVRLVDMLGREVAVLASGRHAEGEHAVALPGALSPGVYAVTVAAGERSATRLVTVVR